MTWAGSPGVLYYLQRGTNISSQPPFVTVQSNIVGQIGTTSYTDTNAVEQGHSCTVSVCSTELRR